MRTGSAAIVDPMKPTKNRWNIPSADEFRAEIVRQFRESGMTQPQFAASRGITASGLQKIMLGVRSVRLDFARKLLGQ